MGAQASLVSTNTGKNVFFDPEVFVRVLHKFRKNRAQGLSVWASVKLAHNLEKALMITIYNGVTNAIRLIPINSHAASFKNTRLGTETVARDGPTTELLHYNVNDEPSAAYPPLTAALLLVKVISDADDVLADAFNN